MDLFLKNYREAVVKSKAFNVNFFKYSKALFEIGSTTKDISKFGWPMPCNTTAVNLEISWASATIECQVILSDEDDMPDLLMSEDVGNFVPMVDFDWVSRTASSPSEYLIVLLSAMLKQFNSHVMERVPPGSRLSEQVAGLLASSRCKNAHWEAHAAPSWPSAGRQQSLHLQMSLPIDCGALSAAVRNRYPEDDMCAQLLFKFDDCCLARSVPVELKLSPSLKNLLQDYQISLKFPDFDASLSSLAAYFGRVVDNFQQRISAISSSCAKRQELVALLLQKHPDCVVEYDSECYQSVSLMLEWNDFRFLALVQLPQEFPHPKQPWRVTLRSLYHCRKSGGRPPFEKKFESPPYSPRWSTSEMAERLLAFLLSSVPVFQRESVAVA